MCISDWSSDVCSSDLRRGLRALAVPGLEVERLLLLHVLVGEGVEAAAGELRAQRVVDPLAVAAHAATEELDHQQVGVSVDHHAGQSVAFAVDHAPIVGHRLDVADLAAPAHRYTDPVRKQSPFDLTLPLP